MRTNTRTKIKRNIGIVTGGLMILGGLVFTGLAIQHFAGVTPTARAQAGPMPREAPSQLNCSNATLTGKYAITGNGFVPGGPPPAPMVPFANVSQMTLDGAGNLSNDITVSRNGQIFRNIDSGSYTVDADCTGTMTITISGPPFQLTFDLVVADLQGVEVREFYLIATTPSVVTHSAKRIR